MKDNYEVKKYNYNDKEDKTISNHELVDYFTFSFHLIIVISHI